MIVDSTTYKERRLVCRRCEEYQKVIRICKYCGCFVPAKTKMQAASCPKGYWTEINITK